MVNDPLRNTVMLAVTAVRISTALVQKITSASIVEFIGAIKSTRTSSKTEN